MSNVICTYIYLCIRNYVQYTIALVQTTANRNRLFMVSKRSFLFLSILLSITPSNRQPVKKIRQTTAMDFRLKKTKKQVN